MDAGPLLQELYAALQPALNAGTLAEVADNELGLELFATALQKVSRNGAPPHPRNLTRSPRTHAKAHASRATPQLCECCAAAGGRAVERGRVCCGGKGWGRGRGCGGRGMVPSFPGRFAVSMPRARTMQRVSRSCTAPVHVPPLSCDFTAAENRAAIVSSGLMKAVVAAAEAWRNSARVQRAVIGLLRNLSVTGTRRCPHAGHRSRAHMCSPRVRHPRHPSALFGAWPPSVLLLPIRRRGGLVRSSYPVAHATSQGSSSTACSARGCGLVQQGCICRPCVA
jgi:hypothetical protein